MIDKSLKSISWDVTEEEYRQDPAFSYSTLAKYERGGFEGLVTLFDKVESPSLTFGSMVDELITGSLESFNSRFLVAEFPNISDTLAVIAKTLFSRYSGTYGSIDSIPDETLAEVGAECGFYVAKKYENYRVKLIKEGCGEYYKLLYLAKDKTIVSTNDYRDAGNAALSLKSSVATRRYFEADNPFDNIERLYQLKFKATLGETDFRCMADLIVVDHDKKEIHPVDLKTSGKPEWDFFKSFIDWNYQIQARLYWRIIKHCVSQDPYFRNFELLPYKFIVVNKKTLVPLVWSFEDTCKYGTLTYGKQSQIAFRDPYEIAKELSMYLEQSRKVPLGIDAEECNSLEKWLNTL